MSHVYMFIYMPHRFLAVFYFDWVANYFIAGCELGCGFNEHLILYNRSKFFIKVKKLVLSFNYSSMQWNFSPPTHKANKVHACTLFVSFAVQFIAEFMFNILESNNCFNGFCYLINKWFEQSPCGFIRIWIPSLMINSNVPFF